MRGSAGRTQNHRRYHEFTGEVALLTRVTKGERAYYTIAKGGKM